MLCRAKGYRSKLTENGCSSLLGSEQRAAKDVFNARFAGMEKSPGGSRLLLTRITQRPVAVVKPCISNCISVTQEVENHRASMTDGNTHH